MSQKNNRVLGAFRCREGKVREGKERGGERERREGKGEGERGKRKRGWSFIYPKTIPGDF